MLSIQIIAPLAGIWKEMCIDIMEPNPLGLRPYRWRKMLVPTSLNKFGLSIREGPPLKVFYR